ncbi:MAG: DedA family protein [Elusimicrobiales bacterium]|nr:DedA family protein [Elusimicrobiales bacterium]
MLDILAGYLDTIAALAPAWGYVFIFFFMAVESSFIPFPSEIVMIPAGFLAARGELTSGNPYIDLPLAIAAGLAGSLAGAFFNYYLSAKLGEPFLRKYGKYFFLKPEALDRAYEVFNKYGSVTTFICRLIPVIRQLISIPAGLSGMPKAKFAMFTGLGAGIWTAILAATGFWLGRTAGNITYLELVHQGKHMVMAHLWEILLAAAVLAAVYMYISRLVMKKKLS